VFYLAIFYELIKSIEDTLIAINIKIIYLFVCCKDNKAQYIIIYNI